MSKNRGPIYIRVRDADGRSITTQVNNPNWVKKVDKKRAKAKVAKQARKRNR